MKKTTKKTKAAPKSAKKETAEVKKTVAPLKVEDETKKITAKPEPKKIASTETKKIAEKKVEKPVKKTTTAKKTTKKKADNKKKEPTITTKAKAEVYTNMSLAQCIEKMKLMNVHYDYEDYVDILMDEADKNKIVKNIMEGNHIADLKLDFEKDGYDEDLILITLCKVGETMDICAEDFKDIKAGMLENMKFTPGNDGEENAKAYLDAFRLSEKALMIGQRKYINDSHLVSELLDCDVEAFFKHFFKLAYEILPNWQYDDVKFYEEFAYTVLSQYDDLFAAYQLEILLDCADLYIKFNDYQRGDEGYGYILRENEIKDYIYYRFAHVYEAIDMGKAKALAYESLQYVDGRYDYYRKIMDIIEK